ncbi:hypothetical protein IKG33_02615 [Candidatus Saccharibacteria bacterium]|nr:hypothetical protein [Candidatus Saccharibacteria bacterium]
MKRLFLLVLVSLIGIINSPEFLMASDTVSITGIDNTGIVETVPLPEPEPVVVEISKPLSTQASVLTSAPAPVRPVVPTNSISFLGRTINIVDVNDTTVNAGNHVNKYGSKFLYGHNSAGVFGALTGLGVGSTFSVIYNGVVTNYQVREVITYEKNTDNGRLQLNGRGNYMRAVANATNKDTGAVYDISLMTCAGTSYGNGDASHRLVIFANVI